MKTELSYRPTCYEQLIIDLTKNPDANLLYENYPEFKKRGHSKEEFEAWAAYSKFSLFVTQFGGNDNTKKEYQKAALELLQKGVSLSDELNQKWFQASEKIGKNKTFAPCEALAAEYVIPQYRFFPEEIAAFKQAEEQGRVKSAVLKYSDRYGQKTAFCYPYLNIPANEGGRPDILVAFSGHQQTGCWFVEAVYHYLKNKIARYKKEGLNCEKIVDRLLEQPLYVASLGMTDNQGLTDWNPRFVFRQKHEYGMYFRHMAFGGLPLGLINKLSMLEVKDTSTEENIGFIIDTLKHYKLNDVNLILLGYPVYQWRTMVEFAKGFAKRIDVPDVYLRIADIPTKRNAGDITQTRFLSYDSLEMQGLDLISNCIANPFRQTEGENAARFPLPDGGKFPEAMKPLLQLALGYSYKNIPHELCGTNEDVALILKLNRSLMLLQHDKGYSGEVQDRQQMQLAIQTNKNLIAAGFTTQELISQADFLSEKEFYEALVDLYC